MSEYNIIVQPSASEGIEEIYDWIFQNSPRQADRWKEKILAAIKALESEPQRFPLAPENEWFEEDVRLLLYGKRRGQYRIHYTIDAAAREVHILYVRSWARRRFDRNFPPG